MAGATAIWRPHAVRIRGLPSSIRGFRLCRDKDRKDWRFVTRSVEVLQIQGVVPCLVVVGDTELVFSALELNGENNWPGNHHSIDSAAESRNVELKKDCARKSTQNVAENANLLLPCLPLIDVKVMGVRCDQSTEDLLWISS